MFSTAIGLLVAELPPRHRLEEFLHRADATRERDVGVAQLMHLLLPLVHGGHHVQLGQSLMRQLPIDKFLRNDPNRPATFGQDRISQDTH